MNVPVRAPCPDGKNLEAPPVSWQMSKLNFALVRTYRLKFRARHVLYGCAMLVCRMAQRLTTPLLVTLHWTEIGDLHDDGLPERSGEVGRVWVLVSGEREAAAACIACT